MAASGRTVCSTVDVALSTVSCSKLQDLKPAAWLAVKATKIVANCEYIKQPEKEKRLRAD